MLKFLFIFYFIGLELTEGFKCKKSSEVQQAYRQTNLGALVQSTSFPTPQSMRVGIGYDIHRVVDFKTGGKALRLGGIEIPDDSVQVIAHSDGDVVLHSIADAILGALGMGDIGDFYPDSDSSYENYDSSSILLNVKHMMHDLNYLLVNVDVCIMLEAPKLGSTKSRIKQNLKYLLGGDTTVNVKAKTNEKLDSVGTGSAVACQSIALLQHRF